MLQWDDDFYSDETGPQGTPSGAQLDLDIYLADENGTILFGFNRDNNGDEVLEGGDPIEVLPFTVELPEGATGTIANLLIESADGPTNANFRYVVFRSPLNGFNQE